MDNHFIPNQVWSKRIKRKNYSQQFFFYSYIVELCSVQSSACIVDSIKNSVIFLPQHCSHDIVTCITHKLKGKLPIWCDYYMHRNQFPFSGIEGLVALLIKFEGHPLHKKIR